MSSAKLTPQNAFIFRIVHITNLAWIIENGMCCLNSTNQNPSYRTIGNPDIIQRRRNRPVPLHPFGTLADYVPFYFTPYSPMLYNIETGYGGITRVPPRDIIIFVSSLYHITELQLSFLYTDRHAYLAHAQYFDTIYQLPDVINWTILQLRDFKKDPENPEKSERYQAETLIYSHVPVSAFKGIICYDNDVREYVRTECEQRNVHIPIHATSRWYFT
jgi:hypothetical protein